MRFARQIFTVLIAAIFVAPFCFAAPVEPVASLAQKQKKPMLETMERLVSIESGSADREGLERISEVIGARLKELGAEVEMIEPGGDIYRMIDTPAKPGRMVRATLRGSGNRKILLLAHMDTVYPRGMLAQQPFRIDGDRAYGLGIADDKHGIALILHSLAILQEMKFNQYGTLTVLINGDEEISSPASRAMITKLGAEHDVVMSFEDGGDGPEMDRIRLATSGIGLAVLAVRGKASHAGAAPERGVNALYELCNQILQARDLSEPEAGIKVNWTMASAGVVRNMIPPEAQAQADVRVDRASDLDRVEQKLRERIKVKLLPDAEVTLSFERRRPPLQATDASRALAARAQKIYTELDRQLTVRDTPTGGGTDAAFAASQSKAAVIEGFGLRGFGAHSTNAEYILIDSIEPRLYLAVRMIMEASKQ
jgi:glutamate carboxypeptidase